MTRLACRTQHGIHTEVHVRHHITKQNHRHELTGVGQRRIRSTEEDQDRIEEYQTDDHKGEADNQVQRYRITQQVLSRLIVTLPQFHTDTRRRAHTHGSTEGCTQVHKGESDTKTRNSLRPHNLTDHGTVDDIVEARCRHGYNGRQGILP